MFASDVCTASANRARLFRDEVSLAKPRDKLMDDYKRGRRVSARYLRTIKFEIIHQN